MVKKRISKRISKRINKSKNPNASYNCAVSLGSASDLFKKIMPKSELVYFPTISELKKLPILTNMPPKATAITILSKIQRTESYLYRILYKIMDTIIPTVAPWLDKPLNPINSHPELSILKGRKISRRLFKIETEDALTLDENIFYEKQVVGKVVSETPAFGIFKMEKFKNYADNILITSSDKKLKLIRQNWLKI